MLEGVYLIFHFEFGLVLADSSEYAFGVETHGGDVETVAMDEARGVGFHQLHAGIECIGHIHHVHVGAFTDGAYEFFATDSAVVNVAGIIGGTATRRCHIRNESGETY